LHDISKVKSKFYIQTHSTNPLLSIESLTNSLKFFKENFPTYDSLFSVSKKQTRLWDSLARPINHNQNILIRTQDLPPIYEENSCIYIFEREYLIKNCNRIGMRPFLFEIDQYESIDIDEAEDFEFAEKMFQFNKKS
jgi:CMP-N-acetylneuraminic acid synthetase